MKTKIVIIILFISLITVGFTPTSTRGATTYIDDYSIWPQQVAEGEKIYFNMTIYNSGDTSSKTVDVFLYYDGTKVNSTTITISPLDSNYANLTWDTTNNRSVSQPYSEEYQIGQGEDIEWYFNDDDGVDQHVSGEHVKVGPYLEMTDYNTPDEVTYGEKVTFRMRILNHNDTQTYTPFIYLYVRNSTGDLIQVNSTSVLLSRFGDSGDEKDVYLGWDTSGWEVKNYTVGVGEDIYFYFSNDLGQTMYVENEYVNVTETADYTISDTSVEPSVPDIAYEGQDIYFNMTVSTYPETSNVDVNLRLYVEGNLEDSINTTQSGDGTSVTYPLIWSTSTGDEGYYYVGEDWDIEAYAVETSEYIKDEEVDVDKAPPYYTVDHTGIYPDTVTEGEVMNFTFTIDSYKNYSAQGNLSLKVQGTLVDHIHFTQPADSTYVYTLQWHTEIGDLGTYDVGDGLDIEQFANETGFYREGDTVTVEEDTSYYIYSTEIHPKIACEGNTIQFNFTINSYPSHNAEGTLNLVVSGTEEDSISFSQGAGEQHTYTLEWITGSGDAGTYDVDNNSDIEAYSVENHEYIENETVEINLAPPYYNIVSSNVEPTTVTQGRTVDFNFTVESYANYDADVSLELYIEGSLEDTLDVPQENSTTETYTLTWDTSSFETKEYDVGESLDIEAYSPDTNEYISGYTVTVEEPVYYHIIESHTTVEPTTVGENSTVYFNFTVSSDPEYNADGNLYVDIQGTTTDSYSFSIQAGNVETYTLTWNTGPNDEGVYDVGQGLDIEAYALESGFYIEDETVNVERHSLTIYTTGNGSVNVDPVKSSYNHLSEVELTADADNLWHFDKWSGDVQSSKIQITVVMDSDKSITANFEEGAVHSLNINIEGEGEVWHDSSWPLNRIPEGETINLTAVPDHGNIFDTWKGESTTDDREISINMTSNKTVTAVFISVIVITSPDQGETIEGRDIEVKWDINVDSSRYTHIEVRLDNGSWMNIGDAEGYMFYDTEEGNKTVTVRLMDGRTEIGRDEVSVDFKRVDFYEKYAVWPMMMMLILLTIFAVIYRLIKTVNKRRKKN